MSRSQLHLADELLALGTRLTLPVAASLALAAGIGLHALTWLSVPAAVKPADIGAAIIIQALRSAGSVLQYVVPMVLLGGALVAGLRRRHARTLHDQVREGTTALPDISWVSFERLVAEYFRRRGFAVEQGGGAQPDGGVDLTLRRGGDTYLVQCKHWRARRVGVTTVRELYGVMAARGAAGAYVVTSGAFTADAEAFAVGREIQLVDAAHLDLSPHGEAGSATTVTDDGASTRSPAPRVPVAAVAASGANGRQEPALRSFTCDRCGAPMIRRIARSGVHAGNAFFGCTRFPACRNIHRP